MVIDKKLKSSLRQNQPKVNLLSDDYDGVFWLKENVEYISYTVQNMVSGSFL